MTTGRKRFFAGIAGMAVLGGLTLVPGTPAQAEPTVEEAQERVDELYHEAEVASERYNATEARIKEIRSQLEDLEADEQRQARRLGGVKQNLRSSVLNQFEGSGMSQVSQALTADDPREFLAGLTSASALNGLQSDLVDEYDREVSALELRTKATESRLAEVEKLGAELKKAKDEIDAKVDEAEDLVEELEAEEAAELARANQTSRSAGRETAPATSSVPASGRAKVAIDYAMSKIGGAYVYGATGPSAFDCSGLMLRAWGAAGVGLPRTSSAQYGAGQHVSIGSLQPGDLVFYYSPISHVGMYIGGGQIVHASRPGVGVVTAPVDSMPITGATRVG